MNQDIKEKMANLAFQLKVNVWYEFTCHADSPSDSWPQLYQRHTVRAKGFEPIYRLTESQVMTLETFDFIKKDEE